jgi:predicted TIM-barrel enzyme
VTLEDSPAKVQEICEVAKNINSEVIVLCHGGPIAMPEDAEYVLQRTEGVDGFYGASSMERLPVETAIKDQISQFKDIRFKK